MKATPFKRFKVQFARPSGSPPGGRSERDINAERLRRFAADHGLTGELHSIHPASAYGILEVRCTERLARRLADMPDVDSLREA